MADSDPSDVVSGDYLEALVTQRNNQAFLAGFLDGLGASTVTAALTRPPGACCVELRAASA